MSKMKIPLPKETLDTEDVESMRLMYQSLVPAIVSTRQDLDQIAFRYLATLTTLTAVIVSDSVHIVGWQTKSAMGLVVAVIVAVGLSSLNARNTVYCKLNAAVTRIELAMGGFEPGRYVQEQKLLDWGERGGTFEPVLWSQVKPHMFGLLVVGFLCLGAVIVDTMPVAA